MSVKKSFLLVLFSLISAGILMAQESEPKKKKVEIIPLPVVAVNPTTGVLFGILPGLNWRMGPPETTKASTALIGIYYTTNNQLFTSIRGNAFSEGNRWNLLSDVRFNLNSQPTYGLSSSRSYSSHTTTLEENDTPSDNPYKRIRQSEMMAFNNFRFYQTLQRRYEETDFYYGLGYHLDMYWSIDDKKLDLESDPPRLTHHYRYQQLKGLSTNSYSQSGISLNGTFDSRDNVVNPYSGQMAFISYRIFPRFLGSTTSATQLWMEYRNYFNLDKNRPRHLIALWTYGWFLTTGNTSYMTLPAVGWDMFARSGRPYTQGRFRGEDLVYAEVEWRFPLQKEKDNWGGVVFLNSTTASSRTDNINLFGNIAPGYGCGIRYMINKNKRVNIGLDYGFGIKGAQGLFLNLNEYF